jgi:hypothetical protein
LDAFVAVLEHRGLATESEGEIRASLRTAAHNRSEHFDVWELAEALIQHDELAAAWRARHVTMVERMIGTKTGKLPRVFRHGNGQALIFTRMGQRRFELKPVTIRIIKGRQCRTKIKPFTNDRLQAPTKLRQHQAPSILSR